MKESISDLKIKCQHSSCDVSNYQPWLFLQIRKVSIYLTWLLLHTPLSPNAITLLAMGFGVVASVLLAMGHLIAGLILIQLAIVLDFSDGEVSRYRNQRSKEGSYLDKIYIFLVHPSLFAGITLFEFSVSNQFSILVAGFVNVISVFLLCMVVEYGRKLVVWRHFMNFLSGLDSNFDLNFNNGPVGTKLDENISHSRAFYNQVKNFLYRAHVNELLNFWDFPYIFLLMSLAIILELLVAAGLLATFSISPISLYIYFYALSFPLIVMYFLLKNILLKVVETEYQELTDNFETMIKKLKSK